MRRVFAFLLGALLLCFSFSVSAHSGRTDSSGGHRDNKNKSGLGYYHYHCDGNPPHLHNGGCPYATWSPPAEPEPTPPRYPDSVVVHTDAQEITVGKSAPTQIEISPANAREKGLTWRSSHPAVATVDDKGNIAAKSPGTAKITATAGGGASTSFSVTVLGIPVTELTPSVVKRSLTVSEEFTLTCDIAPKNATEQQLTWESSDPAVVRIDATQKITAVAPGKATITIASADGPSTQCAITVLPAPVTNFLLTLPTIIRVGDIVPLSIVAEPAHAQNKEFTLRCVPPMAATITANQTLHALQKGRLTLHIEGLDLTKEVPLEIAPPLPARVHLPAHPQSLAVGKSIPLQGMVTPKDADEAALFWTVDDPTLAAVEAGQLVALGTGTVTVTARTENGKSASFSIAFYDYTGPITTAVVLTGGGTAAGVAYWRKKKRATP